MPNIRKRLASLFKTQKAAGPSQDQAKKGKTSESLPKETTAKIKAEENANQSPAVLPNPPLQSENSGAPNSPDNQFESSSLLAEIKTNIATAKAPWRGKPISFQTAAWDHRPTELDSLLAGTMEELGEAYVYIRLANRLVWLSEDLGRSSQEIQDNYLKMCKNIAERLDRVMLSAAGEMEQASEPEKNSKAKAVEQVPKPAEAISVKPSEEASRQEEAIAETPPEQGVKLEEAVTAKGAEQGQILEKTITGKAGADRKVQDMARGRDSGKTRASSEADEAEKQHFRGVVKLYIAQGAQGVQISNLMNLLTETQEIKVLSSGGAVGQRSWVILSTENALPLLQILRKMPIVKSAAKMENDIEVTLINP